MCEDKKIWTPGDYVEDIERIPRGLYRADLRNNDYIEPKNVELVGLTTQPAKIARAVLAGKPPNLIGSKIHAPEHETEYHAPLFDFDGPHRIKKSSTPRHHHILVDTYVDVKAYERILRALAAPGLQQHGFVNMMEEHGQTFLRWNTTKQEEV